LTLAASSFGGVGLSLLADRYSKGFRSSGQVEELCGIPVLGALSDLKGSLFRRSQPADCVVEHPSSVFAEQIHEIRFASQNAVGRDGGKTLLVTSCLPDEGKSVLALSLARSLALSGHRVLLCDCDLRHSSIGRLIGENEESQGFADYLRGTCAWEDILRRDPLSGLHYTRPSRPPHSPGALLAPDNLAASFAVLRQRYQYIVVDSPPLAPVADARALAQVADCSIFVVRWIKTPRALVQALLQRLVSATSAPVGVVLTRVDMNDTARFESSDVEKHYRKYRKYYANG
jgi:polysaccharide biosynthesis transport protein